MGIVGALGVLLVDWTSGLALESVGDVMEASGESSAAYASDLARTVLLRRPRGDRVSDAARTEDVIVSSAGVYHLIRFVKAPFTGGLLLYLVLDREAANLALARHRLAAISDRLVDTP
ncbi:hypothetical protein [Phaeacidiphilus oryzae]|uniref:hypothetical protein n=1 Tax=Phaeacidiphilus oryzae TaxID=348818 RepID=UPI00056C9AA8|nr:hypothetical protein [Phaeacidiphilus oryzae]